MEIIKNGFKNERMGVELDVYIIDGKEWFRATNIAKFLGYRDSERFTRVISFEENVSTHNVGSGNIKHNESFINEFGLYEIVCKINKTNLERYNKAREFQQWVFSEVLPSLRKNNAYIDKDNISKEQLVVIEKEIAELKREKDILHNIVYDIADATTMSFTEVSKKLFGKDAKFLKQKLIESGFLAQDGITALIKEGNFNTPSGEVKKMRIFTSTNVEKCRGEDDIRYNKITNFGYMYLKRYFGV